MSKKTLRNTIILTLVAVVLVVTTVFTTLAYLKSSASVTNTFSVGNVGIKLYESPVDKDGKFVEGAVKNSTANSYTLLPGLTYDKDPTVYVDANSADSYVFVTIDNQIEAIEDASKATIDAQMASSGWKKHTEIGGKDVYVYVGVGGDVAKIVKQSSEVQSMDLFTTFSVKPDADVSTYGAKQVNICAYAIQAAGFETVDAAWAALKTEFNIQ